jgi:hypothetical protein
MTWWRSCRVLPWARWHLAYLATERGDLTACDVAHGRFGVPNPTHPLTACPQLLSDNKSRNPICDRTLSEDLISYPHSAQHHYYYCFQ